MNEIAALAERVGADIEHVRKGLGADPRIGPKFLYAGAGFGGSCFPKDLNALMFLAKRLDVPLELVGATERVNTRQKGVLAAKLEKHFGSVAGKTIALWGIAFKPRTDDIREAPALTIIDKLRAGGVKEIVAHDPVAMPNARALYGDGVRFVDNMYDAVDGADALVLVTEWHEFRRPDFERIKKMLKQPVVFDGRNVWDADELRELGFTYYGIGRR
jgi:UDPglucose 6-dehydrogenase